RIFDCISHQGHGVAIGSEISGGIENVSIWDCDLRYSLYGVLVKGTKKRGGYVRNVRVRDSVLPRFSVASALPYNDDGESAPTPPVFSDFTCERIHFTGWSREYWEDEMHLMPFIDLSGYGEAGYEVQNVKISKCFVENCSEIHVKACKNVSIDLNSAGA
ncbi:MAG: glycoside hydrolase family 28 protein, partial [Clostridia bacterium]|nr:glycoside hydrolase family 28 protein [Clostridia bacterium]